MTKHGSIIIALPFAGFYESIWSQGLDCEEEQFAEYEANERQQENNIPAELRLSESEIGGLVYDCADYSAMRYAFIDDYVPAVADLYNDWLGFDLRLQRESMQSPREYNFETDRLFAYTTRATIHRLWAISKADKHAELSKLIAKRFTSRDGFMSFYSNELSDWLAKPLADWDHNELVTLLQACLMVKIDDYPGYQGGAENWENYLHESLHESFYHAFDAGMDWDKFDTACAELRQEKEDAIRADNPDWEPPYRCPATPGIFRTT